MRGNMKTILFVLVSAALAFGQFNFSGYRDTVAVAAFKGTAAGVTKAFDMSRYEEMRVSAMADDTVEAGYDSDSAHFFWGIQVGDVVLNASGLRDTTWRDRFIVDTFDILTAANLVAPTYTIDSAALDPHRVFIDTISVTGYAVQSRQVNPPSWPIFRFFYTWLAGNRVSSSYVVLLFSVSRKLYSNVHIQ
jgi:hypothetical protein